MRILVVEDEKKIATLIQRGLKECGLVVERAHTRPIATLVNTKTTARHRPDDKLRKFLKYL